VKDGCIVWNASVVPVGRSFDSVAAAPSRVLALRFSNSFFLLASSEPESPSPSAAAAL